MMCIVLMILFAFGFIAFKMLYKQSSAVSCGCNAGEQMLTETQLHENAAKVHALRAQRARAAKADLLQRVGDVADSHKGRGRATLASCTHPC